jgi:predicted acylesterase/phospholipase RssA
MVPYVVASKLAGAGLRSVGAEMGLSGTAARIMASDTTAMMLGGALVDGSRELQKGETRFGNIGAGIVGMGVFGAGNSAVRDWSIAKRAFIAYPVIGAIGAEAQHVTSQVLSGQKPTFDDAGTTMLHGAAMNAVMPWVGAGINRALFAASTHAGRPVAADRFAEQTGLRGQSPSLDAKVSEFPLARVKVSYDSNASSVDLSNQNIRIGLGDVRNGSQSLRTATTGERFGHELQHLSLAKQSEPTYRQIAGTLNFAPEQARQQFGSFRASQERTAQSFGEQVRSEINGEKVVARTALQSQEPSQLSRTHNQLFESDWQKFQQSNGAYRPTIDFQAKSSAPAGNEGYKLVLGAGGAKAYYALGALMAAEKLHIPFSQYAGASAGGDLAAGLANGLSPRQLLKVTYDNRSSAYDPTKLYGAIGVPTLGQLTLSNSLVSLERLWEPEVRRMGWTWPDNLELIAAHKNAKTGEYEPRVLTNKDASLAKGLAATGAHEAVFQPVKVGNEYLVDGGHAHMNPVIPNETADGKPAIVFRLGRVKEVPEHLNHPFWDPRAWIPEPDGLPPIVKKMLIEKEMQTPVKNDVDPRHVVIDLDTKIAGLDFWVSADEAREMVRSGFRQGFKQLAQAIKDGRIVPSRKPESTNSGTTTK